MRTRSPAVEVQPQALFRPCMTFIVASPATKPHLLQCWTFTDVISAAMQASQELTGLETRQGTTTRSRQRILYNRQFHSLYAWRSIGGASYNAMQVNIRKRMSQGVQFDFNYTFSKSIDLQSDAERITAWGGTRRKHHQLLGTKPVARCLRF